MQHESEKWISRPCDEAQGHKYNGKTRKEPEEAQTSQDVIKSEESHEKIKKQILSYTSILAQESSDLSHP
jgi:hypothetical protein